MATSWVRIWMHNIYFLNHLTLSDCDYQLLNFCCFFQMIVFGHIGQVGHLVQKHVGAEPVLNHVPRLGLNEMVEIVQDPEVTANFAIHSLV